MTQTRAQRIHRQLPETLLYIADAIEQNPMLHFSAALELARDHFQHDLAEILDKVVRLMQLGMSHFEALQKVAASENIPAFTWIVAAHQPDESFITAATLRRVAERLATDDS